MRIEAQLKNIARAKQKLNRLEREMHSQAGRYVDRGTRMLFDACRVYTSLTDHTLEDLARLGHPYARRFAPHTLHPDWLVHIQSGTLQSGLRMEVTDTPDIITGRVWNETWYDPYLQLGTRYMRPRPYMMQVRLDFEPILRESASHLLRGIVVTVSGP